MQCNLPETILPLWLSQDLHRRAQALQTQQQILVAEVGSIIVCSFILNLMLQNQPSSLTDSVQSYVANLSLKC